MKTSKMKALFLIVFSIIAQVATLQAQAPVTIPAGQIQYAKANQLPPNVIIPESLRGKVILQNIDISAAAINFSVVRRIDAYSAVIKVEGVVKNVGRNKYESGPEQQAAYLYEDNGTGRLRLLAEKVFQNVSVGGEVKVSFNVTHSKSNEFPPAYVLVIGFDPDIYIDGNLKNDDGNTLNNKISKKGELINNLNW